MHHLFVYLLEQQNGSPVALLPYALPKVISVLVLFVIFGGSLQIIVVQVALHSLLLLLRWSFLLPSFNSALFVAPCRQPTTRRQLTVGMSILSYGLRYFSTSLRITFVVDRDHLYLTRNNQSFNAEWTTNLVSYCLRVFYI